MKNYIQRIGQIGLLLALLFMLGGLAVQAQEEDCCHEDTRPRLRVVNATLGVPEADIYVDNTLYYSNIFYGYVSEYIPLTPGSHRLSLRPAGVRVGDPLGNPLDHPFDANQYYTMVMVGTTERNEQPWMLPPDDNITPIPPDQIRVRLVDASRYAPGVEICLNDRCEVLAYRQHSNYFYLKAGTYNLTMRMLDTEELYFDLLPISLQAGEVYSIFVMDPAQGETRPRIICASDTGRYPHQPSPLPGGVQPLPPGGGGAAPLYPPVTGAFLSPTALILLVGGLLLTLGVAGGLWMVRQQLFTK